MYRDPTRVPDSTTLGSLSCPPQASADCAYLVGYAFSGFQAPLHKDSYKSGRTIPVKFWLADATGTRISDAEAATIATEGRAVLTFDGQDHTFGYHPQSDLFQFNLRTDRHLHGDHQLVVTITDTAGNVINTEETTITLR